MAVHEYNLPDPGEGLTEAEIVTWRVKVGDVVKVNDIVVEIETAKSLVELPSPYAGTVLALLAGEGDTVPVGTPIIRIGDPADAEAAAGPAGGAGAGQAAAGEAAAGEPQPAEPEVDLSNPSAGRTDATLVGYGPRSASALRRARRGSATPATMAGSATQMQLQGAFTPGGDTSEVVPADEPPVPADEPPVPADEPPVPADEPPASAAGPPREERPTRPSGAWHHGDVLAKPKVRRLARELGVDLASLTPSGPGGVVTAEDVEAAAAGGGAAGGRAEAGGAAAAAAGGRDDSAGERAEDATTRRVGTLVERREPIKGVRRMMGQAMVESAFTIPHVTEWVTVDVTRTTKLVQRLRSDREMADVRVSALLVVAKAVCLAMRRTPEVNARWDEEAQEVVYAGSVNLGIAAATPRGLVVPNVKGADSLSLAELGRALNELTATAREGRTQPADMAGGTFTITNVGVFGVDAGTPIINPGESAILCVGAVRTQPWVHRGKVRPRDLTTLALSFDHRFIDGEKGSRFLADVASLLEDPSAALRF